MAQSTSFILSRTPESFDCFALRMSGVDLFRAQGAPVRISGMDFAAGSEYSAHPERAAVEGRALTMLFPAAKGRS